MKDGEIDALIAEKVMEFKFDFDSYDQWSPTRSITEAMSVADIICARPDRLNRKIELWTKSRKDYAYAAFKASPVGYGGYEFLGEGEDET